MSITDLEISDEPDNHDLVDKRNTNNTLQEGVIVSDVLEGATAHSLNEATTVQFSDSINNLIEPDTISLTDEETVGKFNGVCNGTLDNAKAFKTFQAYCSLLNDSNSRLLYHEAIYDSCTPTLVEEYDYDYVVQHNTANADETVKLQDNPAYFPVSNQYNPTSNDETIELQDNPAYVPVSNQCNTTSNDETIELQDNPAYIPVSNQCNTTSNDETIELQDNPAYVPVSNQYNTTSNDEIVELQDNPAYIPLGDHSTTDSSDNAVELQGNPAYVSLSNLYMSTVMIQ